MFQNRKIGFYSLAIVPGLQISQYVISGRYRDNILDITKIDDDIKLNHIALLREGKEMVKLIKNLMQPKKLNWIRLYIIMYYVLSRQFKKGIK